MIFQRKSGIYFSSGLVIFPEGEKKILIGLIFQDRGLKTTKRLQISDVIKFIQGLIWAGLSSEV